MVDSFIGIFSVSSVGLPAIFVGVFHLSHVVADGDQPVLFGFVKLNPNLFWVAILVATVGNTLWVAW